MVDEALQEFLNAVDCLPLQLEGVTALESLGRILGKDIVADKYLPPTDRSVVDGYAVRCEDVENASEQKPVILEVVGESRIGETCRVVVKPKTAVWVATGSMIPRGADSVVMIERTRRISGDRVAVHAPTTPGENVVKKGEDVAPGLNVLKKGRRLRSADIGILTALGLTKVHVVRKPTVALISTGNELVDTPKKRDLAKIVDTNRPMLSAMVRELGANPIDFGIVKDSEGEIKAVLRKALRTCDAVMISAGSSVGMKDLVPRCIDDLGNPGMLVHGVAMRPALPTGLAVCGGKPVLSLPGFPVSAIIAFRVFGRPLIAKLSGSELAPEQVVRAVLKEKISGPPGYRTFVRVRVRKTTEGFLAEPLKVQRSSVLMSIVAANGIITIPEHTSSYEAGSMVDVTVVGQLAL